VPAADKTPLLSRQRRSFLIAAAGGLAVFVLVAVLMRTGVLDGLDGRVVNFFAAHHRRQPFNALAQTLDRLDTWWLLILLIAAIVGGLWWSGRMAQAVYLSVSVAVALILNPLLKLAFARPRPTDALVDVSSAAFPSGHTTTATTIATALAVIAWPTRWRWAMIAVAALFSLAMGVSRVYLGVHWASDVLGGWALGFTIAMAVRAVVPWPSPADVAAVRAEDLETAPAAGERGTAASATAVADLPDGAPAIDVVFLDWGNTLMVDNGMREGPMKDWQKVEAEAGAQEALHRLRPRYRLVVATNAGDSPASDVRLALARVGLEEYVDSVVSSADVGDHKPNYAFFRAALLLEGDRGLPLDPRRAVMVGDGTTNDIAGAQRAGIRTIWYNPTKRRFPEGALPPDAVIRKLTELPAAVDRLAGVEPEKRSRKQRKADADAAAAAAAAAAVTALRAATAAEDSAASAAAALPGRDRPDAPAQPAPDALTAMPARERPTSAPAGPPDGR
jgi:membrane-associated phospholipid phosphatase/phosphoglycolate phosphatase-like HAD superfamily hydrolase